MVLKDRKYKVFYQEPIFVLYKYRTCRQIEKNWKVLDQDEKKFKENQALLVKESKVSYFGNCNKLKYPV